MREFYGVTTLHPLGLSAVLALGLAMLLVPRRYAAWPMIVMACFIAPSQRLVVLEADFTLLRLMVLFGVVRVFIKHEWRGFVWKPIDFVFIAWALAGSVAYVAYYGTAAAVGFKMGACYEAFGTYFLFRCIVRDWDDLRYLACGFALVSLPVAAFFLLEWTTGRNLFSIFGGVAEMTYAREGRLRCRGAFAHAILAGCFWAAALPLIGALLWRQGTVRLLAVAGLTASCMIVVLCASSTPVMAVIFGLIGAMAFYMRNWMRCLRWSLLIVLLVLHFAVMKGPVWSLVGRINVVSGATGWHRHHLIDEAIKHVSEWWLIGTSNTEHWGWGLHDITNQYVLEGVRGGVLTLILFVTLIALGFQGVGRLWRASPDRSREVMGWALGVMLFVHVTSFIGVSYFGQIVTVWYLTLATIGSLTPQARPACEAALTREAVRGLGRRLAVRTVPVGARVAGGRGC